MKAKSPSGSGYRDSLGFPVRHQNVPDRHLAKQAEVADNLIKQNGLKSGNTVVLYNKRLKASHNPFGSGNPAIRPDVQVFEKTPNGWRRVGMPVEIEPAGRGFQHKENLYRRNNVGSFEAIEY